MRSSAEAFASAAATAMTPIRSEACSATSSRLARLKKLEITAGCFFAAAPAAASARRRAPAGPRQGGAERPLFWAPAIRAGLKYVFNRSAFWAKILVSRSAPAKIIN